MKQKSFLKRKFLIILGFMAMFLLIYGCNEDDYHTKTSSDNSNVSDEYWSNGFYFKNTSVAELNNSSEFVEVAEKTGIMKKLGHKTSDSKNKLNPNQYDFDFEIELDFVKEIRTENYVSYTFNIYRENSTAYLENLVIISSNNEEVAYIFSYVPDENWITQTQQGIDVPFYGSFTSEEVQLNLKSNTKQSNITYKTGCTELTIIVETQCSCAGHWPGQACTCEADGGTGPSSQSWTFYDCSGSGNSNGTIGNGNSNGNQNGSGGSNNATQTPIVTTPVGMDGRNQNSTSNDENNCITLNELTQTDSLSANIKPIVGDLREKVTLDKEWSACFKRSVAYSGDYAIQMDDVGITEGPSRTRSRLMYGWPYIGQIHTHPVGTYAMFSWLDLARLRDIYKNAPNIYTNTTDNRPHVFIMIVCHNGAVYSLKVDNYNLLNMKIENDLAMAKGSNDEEKEDFLEKILQEYYRKNENNLEKAFLQKYGNYGISLYKATDENLTNWEKLELGNNPNSNNLDVIPKPCN